MYCTPRLIAMSVPATGLTALYRNPLSDVVRFFETRHAKEGYVIVNCCPELPYATDSFRCDSASVAWPSASICAGGGLHLVSNILAIATP